MDRFAYILGYGFGPFLAFLVTFRLCKILDLETTITPPPKKGRFLTLLGSKRVRGSGPPPQKPKKHTFSTPDLQKKAFFYHPQVMAKTFSDTINGSHIKYNKVY